jgi:hypothetical protein
MFKRQNLSRLLENTPACGAGETPRIPDGDYHPIRRVPTIPTHDFDSFEPADFEAFQDGPVVVEVEVEGLGLTAVETVNTAA